ncbi:MAG: sugar phosphate isomerase/epimerase family protein [Atribacterota bacterium]|nr:sugar phosphate isomerase/epimerase [Candidatus Atribacteria bacterium]
MKYGVFAFIWVTNFTRNELYLLEKAKAMGFEGIEISMNESFITSGPIPELKVESKKVGIQCLSSTGLDSQHNIISPDSTIRKKGMDRLKKCLDIAAELGSEILSGVLYAPWGEFTGKARTEEEWDHCKQGLWEAAEYARKCGVVLAIEPVNRFESYFLNTAQEARKLVDEIGSDYIKIHLDTFQMNIEENSLDEAILTAGNKLGYIHCCESHRGIPGTGHIEWEDFFRALFEVGYQGWLTIENFTPDIMLQEFGKQVAIWRKIAEPNDVAQKGLVFLKQCEAKVQKDLSTPKRQ